MHKYIKSYIFIHMREIKFRAWNKTPNLPHLMIYEIGMGTAEQPLGINKALAQYVEHDDWILMQFTGLKDKNGKEIYEGDIVKKQTFPQSGGFTYERIYYIDFNYGSFRLRATGMPLSFGRSSNYGQNLEVIGNIYENPNLLN